MSDSTGRGGARRRAGLLIPLAVALVAAWVSGAPSHPADAAIPTAATSDIPIVDGRAGALPGPGSATAVAGRLGVVDAGAPAGPTTTEAASTTTSTAITSPADGGTSLRTFGTGSSGVDRVVIALGSSTRANIGATDFTIELWLRGLHADNGGGGCTPDIDGWITGNVLVDRDVYGAGDRGDFGISLANGRIATGVAKVSSGITVCGTTDVLDGVWHHIAVTRRAADGRIQLWVDGKLDGSVTSTGAAGDVSYRVGRATIHPADATLVLGAEKHDAGANYPAFRGSFDELRLSTVVRYAAPFTPPSAPFAVDAATAALYHFDAGSGTVAADAVDTSPGVLAVGGASNGPQWQADSPFG